MKTIVLTGGGTAGHVMPHLALIPELTKHFNQFYYIGSHNGIEKRLIGNMNGINYLSVATTKLSRSLTLKNLAIPFKLIKGIFEAKKYLKQINPNIIFSKGGFVSVPVVIAAKWLKIPVVSHESDITLGLANKIIYKRAKVMCVSFERTLQEIPERGVFTGSPIRKKIFEGNKNNVLDFYQVDKQKPTLLFMGGSLGAMAINEAVWKSVKALTQYYNILHIAGKNNINNDLAKIKNYVQVDYVNNIEDFYAAADIVISRAGSNVIFELLALKKVMLLVPLSKKASRGDQILNANYFKQKGYARVLYEEDLTPESLKQKVMQTLKSKVVLLDNMSISTFKNGNQNIIDQILKYSL